MTYYIKLDILQCVTIFGTRTRQVRTYLIVAPNEQKQDKSIFIMTDLMTNSRTCLFVAPICRAVVLCLIISDIKVNF